CKGAGALVRAQPTGRASAPAVRLHPPSPRVTMLAARRHAGPQAMKLRSVLLSCLPAATLIGAAANAQQATPKYRDPSLAPEDRVADLLSRMTLEEKVH